MLGDFIMLDFEVEKLEHASYDRSCKRCGLLVDIDNVDCPHCTGLTDSEMVTMLNGRIDEQEKNVGLGYFFVAASIIIAVVMYGFF